jgi:hypothetical protein
MVRQGRKEGQDESKQIGRKKGEEGRMEGRERTDGRKEGKEKGRKIGCQKRKEGRCKGSH